MLDINGEMRKLGDIWPRIEGGILRNYINGGSPPPHTPKSKEVCITC